jgi:hypothetical protein
MVKVFLNDYAKDLDPELNKQVVSAAMRLVKDKAINNKPCELFFRMACYYTPRSMKQFNSKVDRSSFYSHWHFERPVNSPEKYSEGIELPQPPLERTSRPFYLRTSLGRNARA